MSFINIVNSLSDLVPFMSKWLGKENSSFASYQEIAKKVIAIAKNISGSSDPGKALEILQTEPKLLIAFQKRVMQLEKELEDIYIKDIQNARTRDIAMINSGKYNVRADVMVFAAALGLLACLISLAHYKSSLPGEAVGIISTIAGIFGSCLKDAYSFEFGSSRGSKAKDVTTMLKKSQAF